MKSLLSKSIFNSQFFFYFIVFSLVLIISENKKLSKLSENMQFANIYGGSIENNS